MNTIILYNYSVWGILNFPFLHPKGRNFCKSNGKKYTLEESQMEQNTNFIYNYTFNEQLLPKILTSTGRLIEFNTHAVD